VPVCGPSNWHSKPPRGLRLVGSNPTATGAEHPRLDRSPRRQVCTAWRLVPTWPHRRSAVHHRYVRPSFRACHSSGQQVKLTAVPLQRAGACVRACACACVRACVRAPLRGCARPWVRACSGCGTIRAAVGRQHRSYLREKTALAGHSKDESGTTRVLTSVYE